MVLSHVKQVQEKQVRAVVLYHVPEEGGSVFWELPRGNHLLFLLGTLGKQMAWRKDRATEVILATGGRKEWLLVLTIRTMLFPTVFLSEILI